MKIKHVLFIPLLISGNVTLNAQTPIYNQLNAPQTANAWITGEFRTNGLFGNTSIPDAGGYMLMNASGDPRWIIRGSLAENGNNSGFNFSIVRRNDEGDNIGVPFSISRQTGSVTMPGIVSMGNGSNARNMFSVIGGNMGSANTCGIGFIGSDNSTRTGFLGDASASNEDIYVIADNGNITLMPKNGTVQIAGAITTGRLMTGVNQGLAFGTNNAERMIITSAGSVGIGTSTPGTHKLAVEGSIGARKIKVEQTSWADFVFNEDYRLDSLEEVEKFINEHQHLPDIPSAQEVAANGLDIGEMNKLLLQKIEEQMLYIIEMNKQVQELKKEVRSLKQQNPQ